MPSETIEVLAARYGPRYRWLATVTVMLGTISAVLTTTTVNVAIPDIMGAFGIGQDKAQWLSTGALAAMTVGMLLNAWLLARYGQRRTFIGALCVFIAALLVAGMAPNEAVLIGCRIVQGGVAGVLQPLSMYTLFRVFPPNQRGTAMGLFGMSVILGPALGPTLGGVMIEHFNWRYIFYVAVPVAALGMLLGSIFMPQREDGVRAKFDFAGFTLLAVGLACLLTALSSGQREGWYRTTSSRSSLYRWLPGPVSSFGNCTRRSRSSLCVCSATASSRAPQPLPACSVSVCSALRTSCRFSCRRCRAIRRMHRVCCSCPVG